GHRRRGPQLSHGSLSWVARVLPFERVSYVADVINPCRGGGELSHLRPDDLGLQVALDAGLARFVAPAGLLVATERHRVVVRESAVEPDGSGLEPLGKSVGAAKVFGPHRGGQPIGAVVSQRNGLVLVVERQ